MKIFTNICLHLCIWTQVHQLMSINPNVFMLQIRTKGYIRICGGIDVRG